MRADVGEILYEESQIARRIDALAEELSRDYAGKDTTAVAILNGGLVFMADLLRRIPLPLIVESWAVASYHGTQSTGDVTFRHPHPAGLKGRHVLIVDDILDTGITLRAIRDRLIGEAGAASLRICVLLRKEIGRSRPIEADYVGFDIPDKFVVGYGLDYNGFYRNLPFIGVLTAAAIERRREPALR